MSSPVSSKMQAAPASTSWSKARPIQLVERHRHRGFGRQRGERVAHPVAPRGDRAPRPAGLLDDERVHRPPARLHRAPQRPAIEALAAERDEEHRPDVGMRAERLHHPQRVGVRVAPAEADQVRARLAVRIRHLARHVVRALDEVGDDDRVADPLAPVAAEPAAQHGERMPRRRGAGVSDGHRHSALPPPRSCRWGGSRSSCCAGAPTRPARSARWPNRSGRPT